MRKIKFYTLGCKVNQYDTQSIRERFLSRAFKEAGRDKKADIYLINTCTVTSSADRKSRNIIRSCIRENPGAEVIVTGCLVSKDRDMLSAIKGVSLIISKSFFPDGVTDFKGHTRAFLKVQDGCNNFCSYCKVPLVRGRSRSKPLEFVIREAKNLAGKGFKEIVLTGICLGAYGKDLGKGSIDLASLIDELEKIKGLLRIRLSSIEAGDITERLISRIAKSGKLCPHLHIPIQSGDNDILKKMKRKYTHESYLALINKIKEKAPEVAITTDCLVGFPGENENNFRNTLSLIKKINPLRVHVFPYSPRQGTLAASWFKMQLPKEILNERIKRLGLLAKGCRLRFQEKFKNKRLPVLFESISKERGGYWEGYTGNYIKVYHKSKKPLKNQLVNIKLK